MVACIFIRMNCEHQAKTIEKGCHKSTQGHKTLTQRKNSLFSYSCSLTDIKFLFAMISDHSGQMYLGHLLCCGQFNQITC